jgi:hypothetical protein
MLPHGFYRLLGALLLSSATAIASAQSTQGQAVMVKWQGINFRAHLTGIEGERYHIKYDEHRDGRPDEEWVAAERLSNIDYSPFRRSGGADPGDNPAAGSAATAGLPRRLPTGRYQCSMFISGTGLVNNGEFRLEPDGTYERGGSRGRYTYVAETGRVTFKGGVMDGRAAEYDPRPVAKLNLKGNSGRLLGAGEERTVASCELK